MTDETNQESEQIRQRRANFDELQRLGITPYPHAFERSDSIAALVEAHAQTSGDALEAARIETTTAGRILGIRSFGKANFLVLRTAVRGSRSTSARTPSASGTSRCSSCSTSATSSA